MEAVKEIQEISVHILARLSKGHTRLQIEAELVEQGHDVQFVKDMLREAVKLRSSKKRVLGLALILAGALICLLSCVLSIVLHLSPTTFAVVLYGFTSLGILLAFAGFTQVF